MTGTRARYRILLHTISSLLFVLSCLPVGATLVAVVPTRDGLVIAADSRLTFLGAQCDGAFKILTPAMPARTVAVVTGDAVFVAPPPAGTSDLCGYLKTAPRLLDVNAVVTEALERPGLDVAGIADVRAACVEAVARLGAAYPEALHVYAGKEVFAVVVASYDPVRAESTVRRFAVRMDTGGRVDTSDASEARFGAQSLSTVLIYGETDWAKRAVIAGQGRQFLNAATLEFLEAHRPVAEVATDRALAVAHNVIEAASREAESDPPPSGIGGAVQVRVMGSGIP